MADIFISRESMFFMWPALISSSFISIFVSSYKFSASILPLTLLLTLIFFSHYSKDVAALERCFSWSTSLDENLVVVYFNYLVSYDRRNVSGLRLTSPFPIFIDSSCCFSLNCFSSSCCFSRPSYCFPNISCCSSNIWSDSLDISSDLAKTYLSEMSK